MYTRIAIALVLAVSVSAIAPAEADAQRRGRRTAQSADELEAKRAKVRQRIRALRAWRLTEELDLDDTTAGRLFPVLNRYDDRFTKALTEGQVLRRKLGAAIRRPASDAETNRLIDAMVAHQRTLWKLEDERFSAVRKVLSPQQAARILVVLPEIDRTIHHQIRRAMKRGRDGKRRRGRVKNPFEGAEPARPKGDDTIVNPF